MAGNNIEPPFTEEQRRFISRYKEGKKFSMNELNSIPGKFWSKDGQGLNMKFCLEKIEDDFKIRYMDEYWSFFDKKKKE